MGCRSRRILCHCREICSNGGPDIRLWHTANGCYPCAVTSPDVTWPRRADRLLLRPFREEDLDRLLEIRQRPDVYRWLLKTRVDPASFGAAWRRSVDDPFDHSAVVELDGTVIGTGSLDIVDVMGQDDTGPTRGSEGLLGYILDPAFAGRGHATEIGRALLSLAFDELGMRRVTAGCYAANTASWRVMEKLGMRREQHGIRDSWHAELGWVDGLTYGILAEEWRQPVRP